MHVSLDVNKLTHVKLGYDASGLVAAHRCVKQMMWWVDTHMDDECRVVFFQSASEPKEVLVAPAYLILTGVKLTPRGLEESSKSEGDYCIINATVL